jgi:hypothetical protein
MNYVAARASRRDAALSQVGDFQDEHVTPTLPRFGQTPHRIFINGLIRPVFGLQQQMSSCA